MKESRVDATTIGRGLLLGTFLTAPLIGLLYLGDQLLNLPFLPFDLFDWITRVLPGPVITFGIDLMIDTLRFLGIDVADTAKTAEQISAVLQFVVIGAVTGAIFLAFLRWRNQRPNNVDGLVLGALFGFPLVAISAAISQSPVHPLLRSAWLVLLFLGWGLAFGYGARRLWAPAAVAEATEVADVERIDRRQFIIRLGASTATVTVVSAGLGAVLARSERNRQALAETASHQTDGAPGGAPFPNAKDPVVPAPGTRPEYTPLKDHYKVFIRTEPSVIDGASWVLPITGLVANPLMLTIDDLRNNYEERDQYVTLRCISGRIGTGLISTTQWTGVSMQDILADAQVQPSARYLYITSEDGFYETVDLELIDNDERIMLCYAWDGNPLPSDHGFPLRIWIPDLYGMKQPKWITGIEVTDEYKEGYWVERNWDEVARVKTTSVVDTVAVDALIEGGDQPLVPVGGIAYSGARGISRVQVRVDGGSWEDAQLRAPLSETTWVVWRYEWPFSAGEHTFEVRCFEGDGTQQIAESSDARPDGATGIHSRDATL